MGELYEIMARSEAWKRLQERSPDAADRFAVNLKHDFVNVLQSVVQAADESLIVARRADAAHSALLRDLYDPDDGDFTKVRNYIDRKYARWSALSGTVAGGIVVALVAFFVSRSGA